MSSLISKPPPVRLEPPVGLGITSSDVPGVSVVHKFGRNEAVGTSYEPVSVGGVYQMVQTGSATTLRVAAGNANDTAAGSGAREVTLQGLDSTGAEVTEVVATAGTSASSATTASFIRLYRAWVSKSGTYATSTTGSHSADIVIENSAGGTTWATLDSTNYPKGQTEIGFYSVPLNKRAFIANISVYVESAKTADVILFQRTSILQTSAPYDGMREVLRLGAVDGPANIQETTPFGPFAASTDIGFMARAGTSSQVGVNFEILLEDA